MWLVDMRAPPTVIAIITVVMFAHLAACEGFEPSIEPLIIPTAPPQAFQNFATPGDPQFTSLDSDTPVETSPITDSVARESFGLDSALGSSPLVGAGALGVVLAMTLAFARLELVAAENICSGGLVAGLLGFFALIPFDYAAAVSAAALAATGPSGVLLDLFVILPLELIVINLHIGFVSLAFHARNRSCADLEPKKYFLPPWGFEG